MTDTETDEGTGDASGDEEGAAATEAARVAEAAAAASGEGEGAATGDEKNAAGEGAGSVADTKTLLSDDGGDGEGGAPSKYAFTPPEGLDIEINEQVQGQLDAFADQAKVQGLTQDQYQSLVEWDIQRGRDAVEAAATSYQERMEGWADATRTDKVLGGEDLAQNLAVANVTMDKYADAELRALFDKPSKENPEGFGLGNHPAVLRFLHLVGKDLSEGGALIEGGDAPTTDDSLRRMYPSMFKEAS
jgi:hypothetical protein